MDEANMGSNEAEYDKREAHQCRAKADKVSKKGEYAVVRKEQQVSQVRRSMEQVIEDEITPFSTLHDVDELSVRGVAIMKVLRRMPEDAYRKLTTLAVEDTPYYWFIPNADMFAAVTAFLVTQEGGTRKMRLDSGFAYRAHSRVIYLSPALESMSLDFAVGIVAIQIAHIVRDDDPFEPHTIGRYADRSFDAHLEDALSLISDWGFGAEAKSVQTRQKRYQAAELRLIRKISKAIEEVE